MNVNDYLAKVYENPPCWLLVADVYSTELNEIVTDYKTISTSIRSIASVFRIALHKSPNGFQQIFVQQDFAIALLGKSNRLGFHHCGVMYDNKLLHANSTGVVYQDMSSVADAYPLIEFWAKQ